MRKSLLALLTSAVLLGGVPAAVHAETPAAAAQDPAFQRKVVLVNRYLAAIHFEELMDNMMKSMMPAMVESMRQQRPGMTAEQSKAVSDTVIEVMAEFTPEFGKESALLYAETFTEEELTQLVTFYESPVGQSIMVKTNSMTPKMTQLMVRMMPELQSKMATKLCTKIDCGAAKPAA